MQRGSGHCTNKQCRGGNGRGPVVKMQMENMRLVCYHSNIIVNSMMRLVGILPLSMKNVTVEMTYVHL